MQYVQWNDTLSLGVEKIDKQHKKLVMILNESYEMMMSYADMDLFSKKIDDLKEYAAEHFEYEEKFMEKIHYPELTEHIKKHRNFVIELNELENKLIKKKKTATAEIFLFLKKWLIEHIKKDDQHYSDFLLSL